MPNTQTIHRRKIKSIQKLTDIWRAKPEVRMVNVITLYRIVTFPFLIALVFMKRMDAFQWLLIFSFLTDAADGYLARKYKATSMLGSRLDSIGDVLTIIAALTGMFVTKSEFVRSEVLFISILIGLFAVQLIVAFIRYGRISSFHTYLAKIAAVLLAVFVCSLFVFDEPIYWLFYLVILLTALELTEEIILTLVLSEWKTDVKGLYWVWKSKRKKSRQSTGTPV